MGIRQKKLLEVKKSQPHKGITPPATGHSVLCTNPDCHTWEEVSGDHESTSLLYQASRQAPQPLLNKKWA